MRLSIKNIAFAVLTQLIFSAPDLQAQHTLSWKKHYGGTSNDDASSIALSADGNYYITGTSNSNNIDVNDHRGAVNVSDYWVIKLDPAGTFIWKKSFGGTGRDYGDVLSATADSGCIIAGRTRSVDGDVTGGGNHDPSQTYSDLWVVKLDKQGVIQWQKCFGSVKNEWPRSIKPTPDGGYIIAASCDSIGGDISRHMGKEDFWIVKLSSQGTLQWEKTIGGSASDVPYSVENAQGGGYLVLGSTASSDGDINNTNHGVNTKDFLLVRFDAGGNVVWKKTYGGTATDDPGCIINVSTGGYLMSGRSTSTNGDLSPRAYGTAWAVRIDTAGAIKWQKTYGGTLSESLNDIKEDRDGGFIFAGEAWSDDGGVNGQHGVGYSWDHWALKTDSLGTAKWNQCYGGTQPDDIAGIIITGDNEYVMSGCNGNGGGDYANHYGAGDYWVLKIRCLLPVPVITFSNGSLSSNYPTGNQWFENGQLLTGATGQTYATPVTGNSYTVRVTNECGAVTSDPLVVTGINENGPSSAVFTVSPNPVREKAMVNITLPDGAWKATLNIYDLQGRLIRSMLPEKSQGPLAIDAGDFENGVYLLELSVDGQSLKKKITVIR